MDRKILSREGGTDQYKYGTPCFNRLRRIDITVGGPVTVRGAGAQGVRVGIVSGGAPARMAALDAQGYRRQTVTVNGAITSTAEGVYLAGGGRVIIGPSGSITSGSGIAILATGTVPAVADDPNTMDINEAMPAIPPRLRVDLNPGGQRMTGEGGWLASALGGGWILNDGGETTIAVNGTVLHDGATGVVANAVAHNGVWDVTIRREGVTVDDRRNADPAMWTIAPPAPGVIADRDFNANDFTEVRIFMEEYAPRAALYEALPDFLLGLHTGSPPPDLPVWIELSGHTGSQDFNRSTVDTRYDTEHLIVSAGVTVPVISHWKIDASVHQVSGSADVSSPVKGGDIDARGQGLSLGARWHGEHDYYATGRVSWTDYDLDISSDNIGLLISNVEADRLALRVEAGRRMAWGERAHWTPQVRVDHIQVRVDRFTDAVGGRASFPRAERHRASLGVLADTTKEAWGGELSLWGSVHLKHAFGDTSTTSRVSGERLRAKPQADSVQLGLGATWQQGPWALNVALSALQASGGSHAYSGSLNVGMQF